MVAEHKTLNWLHRYGYFYTPEAMKYGLVTEDDLTKIRLRDGVAQAALREAQDFNGIVLDAFAMEEHGRIARHDGIIGPATEKLITMDRCGEPDFYSPMDSEIMAAVGSGGNWPRCHGIGNFHAASINVTNNPPSHVAPHFPEIIRRVTEANRKIGLQLFWDGVGSPIKSGKRPYNLTFTWVLTSSGWIGLAQVASNRGCTASTLFSRYLARYMSGSSAEAIIRQWCVLILHEIGHNMGSGHTRGGIMNPSILSLPASWSNDTLLPWLRSRYGGVEVPTTDDPRPPNGDGPDKSDTFLRGQLELVRGGVVEGKYMMVPVPSIL